MTPRIRKLALTVHVITSVGWLGAVAAVLAVAVAALVSHDPDFVRAAFLVMERLGWLALVPLALASFLSGLVQSVVTHWGLLQHYWVVAKLLITVVATAVLVLYMQTLEHFAGIAREDPAIGHIAELRTPSVVLHAGSALLLLVTATAFAVYKPRGLTRRGRRKRLEERRASAAAR